MLEEITRVTIAGLGMVGSSLAKALWTLTPAKVIVGIDNDPDVVEKMLAAGFITHGSTKPIPEVEASEIVFICTPTEKILDNVVEFSRIVSPECILTDTGEAKADIVRAIEKLPENFHFIGGHPMTGWDKESFAVKGTSLFENVPYALVPCSRTSEEDLKTLRSLVLRIGSVPIHMTAEAHDHVVSVMNHTPRIVASGLFNLVKRLGYEEDLATRKLIVGEFRSAVGSPSVEPERAKRICINNRESLDEILEVYVKILNEFRDALKKQDEAKILEFFEEAKFSRELLAPSLHDLIQVNEYELIIDVPNHAGAVGIIGNLIGDAKIRLTAVNVINTNEAGHFFLRLVFENARALEKARSLFFARGYSISPS